MTVAVVSLFVHVGAGNSRSVLTTTHPVGTGSYSLTGFALSVEILLKEVKSPLIQI